VRRGALLRVALMLLVALILVLRVGCGGRPTAPVLGERGPAGLSSGEGEERAARAAEEPGGALLTAIPGTFMDQNGRARSLSEFRGAPFIVSLIYTRCPSVCPRLVAELKRLERGPVGWRPRFVLVSLDPAHDDPRTLAAFATAHALDRVHWTLLAPGATALPAIAGALGVAWAADPGGGIAHSAVIAVVDSAGRVRDRRIGLDVDTAALAAVWREIVTAQFHGSD